MWRSHYYYRSSRDGRTVRTEYVGTGQAAAVAELQDRRRREARTAAVAVRRSAELAGRREHDRARKRAARADAALRGGLEALGYHRTYRLWRRRHDALDPTNPPPPAIKAGLELEDLVRSMCVDASARSPELRSQIARELVVKRAELGGPDPVPTAVMLAIGAALVAWLEYWTTQAIHAAARAQDGNCPLSLDRRLSWAQRRYLSALAAVERIRGLAGRGRRDADRTTPRQIDGPTPGPSPETPPVVAPQGEHGPPGTAPPGRARDFLEPEGPNP